MNGKSRVYEWCGVAYDLATHVFMLYAMKDVSLSIFQVIL